MKRILLIILLLCAVSQAAYVDWTSLEWADPGTSLSVSTTTSTGDTIDMATYYARNVDGGYFYDAGAGALADGTEVTMQIKNGASFSYNCHNGCIVLSNTQDDIQNLIR